jgi:hypothetical protein
MINQKLAPINDRDLILLKERSIDIFVEIEKQRAELDLLNLLEEEHSLAFYCLSNLVRRLGREINEEILHRGIRKDAEIHQRCQTYQKKIFNEGISK